MELVAIFLAVVLTPVLVGSHILLFRRRSANAPGYAHLLPAFGVYGGTWLLILFLLLGRTVTGLDIVSGGSTAGFICMAYMQVFSQICRGFSLRLIVEVDRLGSADLGTLLQEYSDGRGVGWLLDKRLTVLEQTGLIARGQDRIEIGRPLARWIGSAGWRFKKFLRIGVGG